jgi:hypothetical protein
MVPMLRQVCSLAVVSGFVLIAVFLTARDASAASVGCIEYELSPGHHVNGVTVVNHCDAPKLVGICARMEGRMGDLTQGQRVEPNRSFRFEFVNFDDAQFAYQLQYCDPGSTTRMDLCIPQCPAARERSSGNSSNSGNRAATVQRRVTCRCDNSGPSMSLMVAMPSNIRPDDAQARARSACSAFIERSCQQPRDDGSAALAQCNEQMKNVNIIIRDYASSMSGARQRLVGKIPNPEFCAIASGIASVGQDAASKLGQIRQATAGICPEAALAAMDQAIAQMRGQREDAAAAMSRTCE